MVPYKRKTEILRERPIHRVIIEKFAQGMTAKEIAADLNMSLPTVLNVTRQDFAQRIIVESIQKNAAEEIKMLLEQEAVPALRRIVELSKPKTESNPFGSESEAVRATMLTNIVDRFAGKPTQTIKTEVKKAEDMSQEELDAAVAARLSKDA